ncbi:thioredoxin family protein [Labilibaculum sp.]|uniref:thioredoxin family protein n=1 Tax=Labilibaculum sp. TaxID=2060723 RepID=UPI003565A965
MKRITQIAILFIAISLINSVSGSAQNNLEEALAKAKLENKHVFVNFSGSDWCRSCILLKKTILSSHEFAQFADKELIILNVDFPRLKKNKLSDEQTSINEKLAAQYNPNGQFPTILLFDSEANVLGKTGYKSISPAEYVQHIQSFIQ